ncbi:MAG: hypothetical protein QME51_10140 [Planctomycetota bacterium]|nr:hypothetical protein [Planctomycetota bacterium]MDI6788718.1 hypothetical protein [Planctomycetota bacterium]
MIKIYYLGLVIIITLVVWLVIDYRANLAEATNVGEIIPDNSSHNVSISPLKLPPYPKSNLDELWKPDIQIPPPPTPPSIVTKLSYRLTATILLPDSPIALILNPARNEEKEYKIGNKVDEWEVIEIIHEEAKLRNKDGEILHLKIQQGWKSEGLVKEVQDIIKGLPLSATMLPDISPELIKRIIEGKEPSEQVEQYIEALVPTLPPDYVKKTIEEWTGIPKSDMPTDNTKLAEYSKHMFKLVQGKAVESAVNTENVAFSLRVNPDNSPIDQKGAFKTSDRRLYACFSNQGELMGLDKVITRWTNKTTGEVVRLDTKPIDPNAPNNFIWIEKRDGWPGGEYEVELINTQTLRKIAGGNFNVGP